MALASTASTIGIRAGLSVDRASFSLGEWIPLHLRWEDVNATMPLAHALNGKFEKSVHDLFKKLLKRAWV